MNDEWAAAALARVFRSQPAILEGVDGGRVSVHALEVDGSRVLAEIRAGGVAAGARLLSRVNDPAGLAWIMPLRVDAAAALTASRDRVVLVAQPPVPDHDDRRVSRAAVDIRATLALPGGVAAVTVVDLSSFGAGIVTETLGTVVGMRGTLTASLGGSQVEATVEVRSVRAHGDDDRFLGCAFTEISSASRRAIDRFLAGDEHPQGFRYRDLYQD